ncbi:Autoinducer 2-degrading protein LsrG [Aquimixticola soesokkakensis]|uniref:Autoinducer 2-degrading protein LsrG n=1 Tax=Aquimixticola soesokkakensis TaxID=1519096 RepID=A0A1Y5RVV0_9RHOB|nr:putative quinol monooxygenase [Aquimixticola soesokkakensis]SLN26704.1 Autoinducer 2-degrading protein LsrG [Aquimixticola soesokkakensis]
MSYVVLPEFHVTPDNQAAFLDAARADAEASVATEAGCLQFDVIVDDSATPIRVMFYEVYTDRAAFEAHLQTPHLAAFRQALALCTELPVRQFERRVP